MAYYKYKLNSNIGAYSNDSIAFDVGKDRDSYSIATHYSHNPETDLITYKASVIRNWAYNEVPETGKREGKKYKETLFSGTMKQCLAFIDDIVTKQGYWDKHHTESFKEIFIVPVVAETEILA